MEKVAIINKHGQSVVKASTRQLMHYMLNSDVFNLIKSERQISIADALNGEPLHMLARKHEENTIMKAITKLLIFSAEYFNVSNKMSDVQAMQIASLFIDRYGNESLEDLVLCLKYAKLNRYGKTYNRLDGQILFEWFQKYLDEKYQEVENLHRQRRSDMIEHNTQSISAVGSKVLAEIKNRQKVKEHVQKPHYDENMHYEYFRQVVERAGEAQLTDLLADYNRHQKAGNKLVDRYIEVLNTEINKRHASNAKES